METIGISDFGEVSFNTGMTGYQKIFTDPSIMVKFMVATNAHIGNYGVNEMKWSQMDKDIRIGM
jgi:carbamoyl-phosphate synthase small subunit